MTLPPRRSVDCFINASRPCQKDMGGCCFVVMDGNTCLYFVCVQSNIFGAGIPLHFPGALAVFDCRARAAADTGHTMCAPVRPYGFSFFQTDIAERTDPHALPTGYAGFGRIKPPGMYKSRIKKGVDQTAEYPVLGGSRVLQKHLAALNCKRSPVYVWFRMLNHLHRLFPCRR